MTEKRFKPVFSGRYNDVFIGVKDNNEDELLMTSDTIDKLNELSDENEKLKTQLMENNCDNCKYSKSIYAEVECRKKGLTDWKYNCDEFKGDME